MKSQDFKASEIIDSAKSVLASDLLIDERKLDQSAETLRELMEKTGKSRSAIVERTKVLIKEDKLEQVWKRQGRAIVMAYRAKKIS